MITLAEFLSKLGIKKKPKTFTLNITSVQTKSCGNCTHHRKDHGQMRHLCMHYPETEITEVVNKVCSVTERQLWSEKKHGVISRFFKWLF